MKSIQLAVVLQACTLGVLFWHATGSEATAAEPVVLDRDGIAVVLDRIDRLESALSTWTREARAPRAFDADLRKETSQDVDFAALQESMQNLTRSLATVANRMPEPLNHVHLRWPNKDVPAVEALVRQILADPDRASKALQFMSMRSVLDRLGSPDNIYPQNNGTAVWAYWLAGNYTVYRTRNGTKQVRRRERRNLKLCFWNGVVISVQANDGYTD